MRVLLIEDDHVLGAAIRDHVLSTGHAVDWMQRIDDARLALASVSYELVLLETCPMAVASICSRTCDQPETLFRLSSLPRRIRSPFV